MPLEELQVNKKNYLKMIENFLETNIDFKDLDPINVNSFQNKGRKEYNLLKPDIRQKFLNPISSIHRFFIKNSPTYQRKFYKFKAIKSFYEPKLNKIGTFQISEDQKEDIKKIYQDSNKNLEKLFNINLKHYDYF